jgi:hypothetical protein
MLSSNTYWMRSSSARSRASLPLIPSTDLDARSGASVHRALHQRNEDQLGHEERERRAGHPKIDMDHVSQHRK